MWDVMERNTSAIVDYLGHISYTEQYQLEVDRLQKDDDTTTLEALRDEEVQKDKLIQKLTDLTKMYPHNPQLYYNLSILFEERGMKLQSSINLKKAQEIDRDIK